MILVNVFLAILNTSYSNVREERSLEKTRLEKTKELRPSRRGKHAGNGTLGRVTNMARQVFGKKAISTAGIYKRPEVVRRELELREELEEKAANPWIAT